jgi:hypothetical protein
MKNKKNLAMLIVGKKEPNEQESNEYNEEDMGKEAFEFCMDAFISAIHKEDAEKASKLFKKLSYLASMNSDEESDSEEY